MDKTISKDIMKSMIKDLKGPSTERSAKKATVKEVKAKISTAFAALRSQGILAEMNFTCCQTCGGAQMEIDAAKAETSGQKIRGYAFYHAQDEEGLRQTGNVMIAYNYSGVPGKNQADSNLRTKEIGTAVAEAITAAGLKCDWTGDIRRRIGVYQ